MTMHSGWSVSVMAVKKDFQQFDILTSVDSNVSLLLSLETPNDVKSVA